jgi:hypothetical protein
MLSLPLIGKKGMTSYCLIQCNHPLPLAAMLTLGLGMIVRSSVVLLLASTPRRPNVVCLAKFKPSARMWGASSAQCFGYGIEGSSTTSCVAVKTRIVG